MIETKGHTKFFHAMQICLVKNQKKCFKKNPLFGNVNIYEWLVMYQHFSKNIFNIYNTRFNNL